MNLVPVNKLIEMMDSCETDTYGKPAISRQDVVNNATARSKFYKKKIKSLEARLKSAEPLIKAAADLFSNEIDDGGRPGYYDDNASDNYKKAKKWLRESRTEEQ